LDERIFLKFHIKEWVMIELVEHEAGSMSAMSPVSIKVIGIGGAGGNTVNRIVESGYLDIECIVANTDVQALNMSLASVRVQIGVKSTKGLGTGANPDIGERAAEEDLEKIMQAIGDADIVFLAGGMGGGTGSGGMPVIAQALRDKGVLSIAIVTKPFSFEGKRRAKVALEAIERLKKVVDTLIIMPNQKLLEVTDRQVSMIDAFAMMNGVLVQSVRSISDIIAKPGHINVDFADVRAIMKDRGLAVMGTGCATGEDRATEATAQAISSPLLENMSVTGARGILFNITGGVSLGLHEIHEAASLIYKEAHEDANIIVGSVIDESLTDEVVVTIIATGFDPSVAESGINPIKNIAGVVAEQRAADLLAEEAVRAAHELVEALKAETHKVKTAPAVVADTALRDDELMQAIVQEVLREVKRAEQVHSASVKEEVAATAAAAIGTAQEASSEGREQHVSSAAHRESSVVTEPVVEQYIDVNDLDVPAYLRQEAVQEQKQ
jgi:cell division protein FtsZ